MVTKEKTILIAHNWSTVSFSSLSYYLALELSKDHKVIFLNAKPTGHGYEKINNNLEVFDWKGKRPTGLKDAFFLARILLKYRPSVVVAQFAACNLAILGSWLFGIKNTYCYYHTLLQQNKFDRPGQRLSIKDKLLIQRKKITYRMSHRVIAVTECAKEDLIKHYRIPTKKINVLYNGLPDTEARNNFQKITVGFLGRLDFSKGVDILVRAVGYLIEKGVNVDLRIAGTGKERDQLETLIKQNNWSDKIIFVGQIPYSQIHRYISDHYLLVVPSRIDNPSMVILEAFSTQTPVIASDAGAISEVIVDKVNGLLFTSGDHIDLAEKICMLINNRDLREKIAVAGRRSFEEKYSIDKYVVRAKELILENH